MNTNDIKSILESYKNGSLSIDAALEEFKDFPFKDLGYALVDTHRELRVGYPEVVYCAGKNPEQVLGIIAPMLLKDSAVLATRAEVSHWNLINQHQTKLLEELKVVNNLESSFLPLHYDSVSKTISRKNPKKQESLSYVAVVTAGTSDISVAEEACITLEVFGNKVERIYDAGVAGIHRLFARLPLIQGAKVVIVIAGMEGALASVVGGLVTAPVIAVPTSVGYGASLGGIAALLSMLNSCASGVSVVNIDNGFGAGYLASTINAL